MKCSECSVCVWRPWDMRLIEDEESDSAQDDEVYVFDDDNLVSGYQIVNRYCSHCQHVLCSLCYIQMDRPRYCPRCIHYAYINIHFLTDSEQSPNQWLCDSPDEGGQVIKTQFDEDPDDHPECVEDLDIKTAKFMMDITSQSDEESFCTKPTQPTAQPVFALPEHPNYPSKEQKEEEPPLKKRKMN